LTGLPNESLFLVRIAERARRSWQEPFAVLHIDLDRFRLVSEGMGYDAGDALLLRMAQRLQGIVSPGDTVAHLCGDRFGVLLERLQDGEDGTSFAARALHRIREPLELGGREISITASVGIALSSDGFLRPQDLHRFAESALHRAKRSGRRQFQKFEQRMHDQARCRLEIYNDLKDALEGDQLELRYQPVLDLATGAVVAVETLVRWRHPRRGLLLPGDFLTQARQAGLLGVIDRWVLSQACRQAAQWQKEPSMEGVAISVNMAPQRLAEASWSQAVEEALDATGLPPHLLHLEVTEGAAVDLSPESLSRLRRLTRRGVGLWIDDFGTGYCGLSYLSRLPSTALKIDRSFVAGAAASRADEEIVRCIVGLAHRLGKKVIAEGVETSLHRGMLCELGCEWAQGDLFSSPVKGEEIPSLVAAGFGRVPGNEVCAESQLAWAER